MKLVKDIDKSSSKKPEVSDKQAEEAFRTILKWIGEDPNREGLLETPKRVIKAYKEFFAGYFEDPHAILSKTFEEVAGYDEMVIVKQTILKIDQILHVECLKQKIKYRTDTKLHEITMNIYFDDIKFSRYIGEDLERTDFLHSIWCLVSYRQDLVWKYRASHSLYEINLHQIRENNDEK